VILLVLLTLGQSITYPHLILDSKLTLSASPAIGFTHELIFGSK